MLFCSKFSDEIFSYVIDLVTGEMLTRAFENKRINGANEIFSHFKLIF